MISNNFIIPGLGNSGPEHWQTYFENSGDNIQRIDQIEWDAPVCHDWIEKIENTIADYNPETIILIGHSLGCAAIAHWAKHYDKKIKGALLVAPSDLEAPQYTFPAKGFDPIPLDTIDFPTILVASTDDPWVSSDRALFLQKTGEVNLLISVKQGISMLHQDMGNGKKVWKYWKDYFDKNTCETASPKGCGNYKLSFSIYDSIK